MDVLLAHGHYLSADEHERAVMKPYPPLGLLYISGYLRRRGFSVGVYDATFREPDEFGRTLDEERPTVVGIYVNLMTKLHALHMIRDATARGSRVVLGGPEPPAYAEEYLAHGADVVVLGEGEEAMEEIITALAKGVDALHEVSGIVFHDEAGRLVRTTPRSPQPHLDSLPFPDRDAIDMDAYLETWRRHHGRASVSLVCARGCPYHCDWCSHSVYGKTHRRRSPENVASEVELVRDRYAPDQLWYADDVFTIKPSWTSSFARELERRNIRLPFECITRADRLDETIVATIAKMGCFRIWIGSESGSQRVLDAMSRGVRVEQIQSLSRLCRSHGIEVGMFVMVGYEGEERSDLEATVEHLKKADPDIVLTTVAYPIKGTGYYEKVASRIRERGSWATRTDRDLRVAARHSRRYYEAAMRWMVSEVSFYQEVRGRRRLGPLVRSGANWVRGRVGMAWASREVEA